MKIAEFCINKPQSLKELTNYLRLNPFLTCSGEKLVYSARTKNGIVFKTDNQNLHVISLTPGVQFEFGINFFPNRFEYSCGSITRKYFYDK